MVRRITPFKLVRAWIDFRLYPTVSGLFIQRAVFLSEAACRDVAIARTAKRESLLAGRMHAESSAAAAEFDPLRLIGCDAIRVCAFITGQRTANRRFNIAVGESLLSGHRSNGHGEAHGKF
ncbi:MAG: hypothetical protein JWP38_729 [Herbaspirillum sp.]|nr:hypothetical protein [Herbaspirillum sp.]